MSAMDTPPGRGLWAEDTVYVEARLGTAARLQDERDYLAARVGELETDLAEAESIIASALTRRREGGKFTDEVAALLPQLVGEWRLDEMTVKRDQWRALAIMLTGTFAVLLLGSC